jgi:NAD(P)-dependent dehydrogenase (short-subunit alcohol dehydrogenase family)
MPGTRRVPGLVAKTAQEQFGTVHGLANVAGGIAGIGEDLLDRRLESITLEDYEKTLRLNLHTAFLMTQGPGTALWSDAIRQGGERRVYGRIRQL